MRYIGSYLWTTIVSFEFVVVCLAGIAIWHPPGWVKAAASLVNLGPETKGLLLPILMAPVACLSLTFKDVRKILFPSEDKKAEFQKWDDYWDIQVVCNVALFYAILFLIAGIAGAVSQGTNYKVASFILTLASVVGGAITYISVYKAETNVNVLLAKWRRDGKEDNQSR